jgi:hypothetical protein
VSPSSRPPSSSCLGTSGLDLPRHVSVTDRVKYQRAHPSAADGRGGAVSSPFPLPWTRAAVVAGRGRRSIPRGGPGLLIYSLSLAVVPFGGDRRAIAWALD